MEEELKECPFCGEKVNINILHYDIDYLATYVRILHKCENTGIEISMEECVGWMHAREIEQAKVKIINSWNTRL